MRFFFLMLPCLLQLTVLHAQRAPDFTAYTDFLEQEISEERIAGAVSLVVQSGDTLHHGAWGSSNKEDGVAMRTDQVFHIMSMTKPVISVAAMMLWEDGLFKLSDPISKYLPGVESLRVTKDASRGAEGPTTAAGSVPTIRQLLSHTAGFSHGLGGTKLDNDVARGLYFAQQENIGTRVKTLTELPLMFEPGNRWYYSASPDVIALLIEKLTGVTPDSFLRREIFQPLKMHDTGYNMSAAQAARMPRLYKIVDGALERDPMQMPASGHTVFGGTHGLLSTAADYGKFCQMLLNGGEANGHRLLNEATVQLMTDSHIGDVPYAPGSTFGLGFGVTTAVPEDGLDSKGRYYWSGAYSTFFFIDPANDLFAILMTQTSPYTGSYGEALRTQVYRAVKRE